MKRTTPMPPDVQEAFTAELARPTAGQLEERWEALQRAHILSQPWPWPHVVAHWRMLSLAVTERDRREAIGQLIRLVVAAPGSASGRFPVGNTGRASVGLLRPMAMPDDLATILEGTNHGQAATSQ